MSHLFLRTALKIQQDAIQRIKQLEMGMNSLRRLEALEAEMTEAGITCRASALKTLCLMVSEDHIGAAIRLLEGLGYKVIASGELVVIPPHDINDPNAMTFRLLPVDSIA